MIKIKSRLALYLLTVIVVSLNCANGQSTRREYYDSSLVGDQITPAVSSVMMPKTFVEIILNNSLLSTNSYFKSNRESLNVNTRSTYLINTLQLTYGVTRSGRFNAGLDVSYRTARIDGDPESSALKVFGNDSDGLIDYARGITSMGLRARYAVTENKSFVIQHVFTIPFNASSDDNALLGDNRFALNTQLLYNKLLGRKVFLFGQADLIVRFKNDEANADFTNPLNLFVSYLITRHAFPFIQVGMLNVWDKDFDHLSQSFNYGVGFQYQFNTMFTINAFYNDVFAGKDAYRWRGFNLGIRKVF